MEESVKREYFELLGFESVGADPNRLRDCVQCANWLKAHLERMGAKAELVLPDAATCGEAAAFAPPVVLAEFAGDEDAPRLLVYGHYDVQPADPVGEWQTPPFEPTERDGRVWCRGAQDDKGQLFALLCGIGDCLAELRERGGAKPTVKVLIEGQEESGSAALTRLAPTLRRKLAADVLLVCDTSAAADLRPAIVAGLRGVAHFTLRLTGPARDLHSGEYGGLAPNPAQGIAELVASLHNSDGSIAVAGFRDGIEPPTAEELRLAAAGLPDERSLARDIGCEPAGGQIGKSIAQRNAFEPTIEVNGIHSGYAGAGAKTVIPREAFAKISMRLVPGQTPQRALAAVRAHLEARVPRGLKLTVEEISEGAGGFRLPLNSPLFRLAADVLGEMDARGSVFQWDGASIPVISVVREASGAAPLIVGWGQAEDRIHSPNESYSLRQFDRAREWGCRIVRAICQ